MQPRCLQVFSEVLLQRKLPSQSQLPATSASDYNMPVIHAGCFISDMNACSDYRMWMFGELQCVELCGFFSSFRKDALLLYHMPLDVAVTRGWYSDCWFWNCKFLGCQSFTGTDWHLLIRKSYILLCEKKKNKEKMPNCNQKTDRIILNML